MSQTPSSKSCEVPTAPIASNLPLDTIQTPSSLKVSPQIHLTFQHPKDSWDGLLGLKLNEQSYDTLLDGDCDVFTPEGDLLLKLRRKCIPASVAAQAFAVLRTIKAKTNNRGMATGKLYMNSAPSTKADGTASKTTGVASEYAVMSAVIGYFDRYPRIPYCRQTAFNADHPEKFAQVLPFIKACDDVYAREAPERYALQKAWADRTTPEFVIHGTTFTTITVNQNFQTAVHTDKGDLKDGLSCITVLRGGEFQGATLVFPHYRVGVRLDSCDLLMFDSHHMHGNTPLFGKVGAYERVSCVLYYRERMIDCGTAAEELERAKSRKLGDRLHGKL